MEIFFSNFIFWIGWNISRISSIENTLPLSLFYRNTWIELSKKFLITKTTLKLEKFFELKCHLKRILKKVCSLHIFFFFNLFFILLLFARRMLSFLEVKKKLENLEKKCNNSA